MTHFRQHCFTLSLLLIISAPIICNDNDELKARVAGAKIDEKDYIAPVSNRDIGGIGSTFRRVSEAKRDELKAIAGMVGMLSYFNSSRVKQYFWYNTVGYMGLHADETDEEIIKRAASALRPVCKRNAHRLRVEAPDMGSQQGVYQSRAPESDQIDIFHLCFEHGLMCEETHARLVEHVGLPSCE